LARLDSYRFCPKALKPALASHAAAARAGHARPGRSIYLGDVN
jgi:hypothetical protein